MAREIDIALKSRRLTGQFVEITAICANRIVPFLLDLALQLSNLISYKSHLRRIRILVLTAQTCLFHLQINQTGFKAANEASGRRLLTEGIQLTVAILKSLQGIARCRESVLSKCHLFLSKHLLVRANRLVDLIDKALGLFEEGIIQRKGIFC